MYYLVWLWRTYRWKSTWSMPDHSKPTYLSSLPLTFIFLGVVQFKTFFGGRGNRLVYVLIKVLNIALLARRGASAIQLSSSKMPVSCCAYDCTKRFVTGGDTKFYRFPRDPHRRQKWILATRRQGWCPTEHTRICSDHFVEGKKAML